MKQYFLVNKTFNVLNLVDLIQPLAFDLIDNGKSEFILGWTTRKQDIHNFDNTADFFKLVDQDKDYWFGYFGYDLKNEFLPDSTSKNTDIHNFPDACLFKAEFTLIRKHDFTLFYGDELSFNLILKKINLLETNLKKEGDSINQTKILLTPATSEQEYLKNVSDIKENIQKGYSYELNYCTQFKAFNKNLDVIETYGKLRNKSGAPFSTLISINEANILSASPERYLSRIDNTLISQPIKGTAPRSPDPQEDNLFKNKLSNDPKEISENVMIVDLVRNDFSKIAVKNSVKVSELCKIYTFPSVHQLISTVECQIDDNLTTEDIFRATFPMGSMTGAPKLKSTLLIDQFENFKRGIYSGTTGYFAPNKTFDLNVIIRTILYNTINKTVSCSVGGAITIKSSPESEYEECLLKLWLLHNVLNQTL